MQLIKARHALRLGGQIVPPGGQVEVTGEMAKQLVNAMLAEVVQEPQRQKNGRKKAVNEDGDKG